jgi:hypothetical protein
VFYKLGNSSLFTLFYEQTIRYLVNKQGNGVSKKKKKENKEHSLTTEHEDPQINKVPQLLGINLNHNQNLTTGGLLRGRLAFRQERLRSVCYVRIN